MLEAILAVKQWRRLYKQGRPSTGIRLNLQQSAKELGFRKKTLDDYYYQLKSGELY